MTEDSKHMRTIRTFVKRAGRMTPGQEKALEEQWSVLGVNIKDGSLNYAELFGRQAPIVLEIGFGMGDSFLAMAEAAPEKNFIGIEVHEPGVGRLLNNVTKAGLKNVRVFREDALEVLEHCIPDESLDSVQLFFPDPWPKKKHHKRRMVQPEFAQKLRAKLKIGGNFHMATDWEPYAEHMMEVMTEAEGYCNQAGPGGYSPQPQSRPDTKFQRRGEKLGHGVWDLVFERCE
ncbi:tRNA (guanosine(46)-N7)-methyltransferase TrmB [Motiliproteus sp. MSK22-1]|uniref:tRNA (guanosine(46)-N7)-methyltransferase TrmB n=1 Tax=Motiliproteus sp. MSK22-1 TaxID=1897630 RepID=UPI000976BFAD|nr:tRNA (guanosine(46)-N7)-methyltransferase TrmB [Motiliproteus sp. MSK22-1]OMH27984.1 tRNA (guanosine(46)-N7)-methyltransferase TrmB [Motiliproteus sp. MSK22-1]